MLGSEHSQVAAEHGLDVEGSLFLILDAVEYVLVVGVGTGMFFGVTVRTSTVQYL